MAEAPMRRACCLVRRCYNGTQTQIHSWAFHDPLALPYTKCTV